MSLIRQYPATTSSFEDYVELIAIGETESRVYHEAVDASGLETDAGAYADPHRVGHRFGVIHRSHTTCCSQRGLWV